MSNIIGTFQHSVYILFLFFSIDPGKAFLDESKLSKLIRRLFSTAERERRLSSARTLKDFLLTQEGTKVIRIFDSL